MWCEGFCILLLVAASIPTQAQRGIDPISYDGADVPIEGGNCPTQSDSDNAKDGVMQDVQGIIRDNLAPLLQCGLGECEANPGSSCNEIYMANPANPSGMYWIKTCDGGSIMQVYCSMGNTCGCSSGPGGWMRIAYLDMNDADTQCPHEWDILDRDGVNIRVCERGLGRGGCGSAFYKSFNFPYSRVCGRIVGYQFSSPDAFRPYFENRQLTIDDLYVDGVILTHGFAPRTHIWTFANGVDRTDDSSNTYQCPCDGSTYDGAIPPFIGNDWFCDTGSANGGWQRNRFYDSNPLWDGQGCNPASDCCTFNTPPWFCKELPETTTNDIEIRLCADQGIGDETTAIRMYEIYVQ